MDKIDKLLNNLQEKEEIEKICKDNQLNFNLLRSIIFEVFKGYNNNNEISDNLDIHKTSVERYYNFYYKIDKKIKLKIRNFFLNEFIYEIKYLINHREKIPNIKDIYFKKYINELINKRNNKND